MHACRIGHVVREDDRADDVAGPITFVASNEGDPGDGLNIQSDAWDLRRYRANPVVLWAHDHWGRTLPIGRGSRVWTEDARLMVEVTFDASDEFAAAVERKVRAGFLNAVSVGFHARRWEQEEGETTRVVTDAELLEISVVPVPMDAAALAQLSAQMEAVRAGPTSIAAPSAHLPPATPPEADLVSLRDALTTLTSRLTGAPA